MRKSESLLEAVTSWARERPETLGLALVGQHARGEADPDSDVDIVLVCRDQAASLDDTSWVREFGTVEQQAREEWGALTSLRVFYADGPEVESGIAARSWAESRVDPGTAEVVSDGMVVLHDPEGLLAALALSVAEGA